MRLVEVIREKNTNNIISLSDKNILYKNSGYLHFNENARRPYAKWKPIVGSDLFRIKENGLTCLYFNQIKMVYVYVVDLNHSKIDISDYRNHILKELIN